MDAASLEETRMRASQLLSKVLTKWCSLDGRGSHSSHTQPTHPSLPPLSSPLPLLPLYTPPPPPSSSFTITSAQVFLQHLSPLLKLVNFQELWLGILGVLEKYCLIKDSDSLVWGVVGVVTCGRVSACPDQVNYIAHQTNPYVGGGHFEY